MSDPCEKAFNSYCQQSDLGASCPSNCTLFKVGWGVLWGSGMRRATGGLLTGGVA